MKMLRNVKLSEHQHDALKILEFGTFQNLGLGYLTSKICTDIQKSNKSSKSEIFLVPSIFNRRIHQRETICSTSSQSVFPKIPALHNHQFFFYFFLFYFSSSSSSSFSIFSFYFSSFFFFSFFFQC